MPLHLRQLLLLLPQWLPRVHLVLVLQQRFQEYHRTVPIPAVHPGLPFPPPPHQSLLTLPPPLLRRWSAAVLPRVPVGLPLQIAVSPWYQVPGASPSLFP